jgi:antitoxin ParD1/3/4
MASPNNPDVVLDDESAAIVAEAIGAGGFDGPDEVVRQALRTWKAVGERIAALRTAIDEGGASGAGIPAEDVFSELEARYRSLASGAA